MATKVVLDKGGRIVIPKLLREQLQLGPGDSLELESHGEEITLRPVRESVHIRKEEGVWVYRSGQPTQIPLRQLIEEGREERHGAILGLDQ